MWFKNVQETQWKEFLAHGKRCFHVCRRHFAQIPNALTINVVLAALYNIIRSRNDPIEEPGNNPADEEEVDYMRTDEQCL